MAKLGEGDERWIVQVRVYEYLYNSIGDSVEALPIMLQCLMLLKTRCEGCAHSTAWHDAALRLSSSSSEPASCPHIQPLAAHGAIYTAPNEQRLPAPLVGMAAVRG